MRGGMPARGNSDGEGGSEMRKVIIGNHAASYGVLLSKVEVIAAYPITPQTQIVELLSELCGNGTMKARFLKVESEHSALASIIGAASAGARTFTATSSQGLALMHELLHWTSGARLPVIMTNVNRALAPGWNIWADQTDSLSQRDTGWIQIYCETGQEILDLVIIAYRLAELVMLPVMLVYDAFYLSHTSEPVDIPEQNEVDNFLPPYQPKLYLDTENPVTMGSLATPKYYMEMRYDHQRAMEVVPHLFPEITSEFSKIFSRDYGMLEGYLLNDAEKVIVCASTMASTARIVIDELREKGELVGLLKIRFSRPFPYQEIREAILSKKMAIVIDRNLSPGMGGIFAQEIKNSLYGIHNSPQIIGAVTGLGGRDVTPDVIMDIFNKAENNADKRSEILWQGLDISEKRDE